MDDLDTTAMASPPGIGLALPASLDLTHAETLCRDLRAMLLEGGLSIDGSDVERVSTPCLQVLVAAAAAARRAGVGFAINAPAAPLAAAIADLGLADVLGVEG